MEGDGRATPLDYALGNVSPELKEYIDGLRRTILELESRQILHLSLRLAGITGRTSWGGEGPKPLQDHLGIALYFIFGPPGRPAQLVRDLDVQEFGLAFGLSPEKYQELMAGNEILIHEVSPENSRLKPGEQFPIEFLTEGEKDGDLPIIEAPVHGDSGPGNDGGSRGDEGGEPGAEIPGRGTGV